MILNTATYWNNLYITHELLDPKDYTKTFIYAIDLLKIFSMTNVDMKIYGQFFTTFDALNLNLQNIRFDFDYATWGFRCDVECNFPEAPTEAEMVLFNNTVFSGSGSKYDKASMMNAYFSYLGPGNVTLTHSKFLAESDLRTMRSVVRLRLMTGCLADAKTTQFFKIKHNFLTLPQEFGV